MTITHTELTRILDYDSTTGIFTWSASARDGYKLAAKRVAGNVAGTIGSHGYRKIGIDGKLYAAHRLAWFYVHGVWPTSQIDHINRKKADNRIANLRDATQAQNARNREAYGRSKLKGAYRDRTRWRAQIQVGGKCVHLGSYATAEEAHAAFCGAAAILGDEYQHVA